MGLSLRDSSAFTFNSTNRFSINEGSPPFSEIPPPILTEHREFRPGLAPCFRFTAQNSSMLICHSFLQSNDSLPPPLTTLIFQALSAWDKSPSSGQCSPFRKQSTFQCRFIALFRERMRLDCPIMVLLFFSFLQWGSFLCDLQYSRTIAEEEE